MRKSTSVLLVGVFVIITGHQVSGLGGIELGANLGKDGLAIRGSKHIGIPGIGGIQGSGHIGLNKDGLELGGQIGLYHGGKGAPSVPRVSAPDLGVSTPDLGVSLPDLGVTTPDLGVSLPDLGVTTPDLGVSLPDLGVTTPDLGVSLPNLGVTTPDLGVSLPNLGASTPGLGVSLPGLRMTSPSQPTTLPAAETSLETLPATDTPTPRPSTPTPKTITLETTPAGQTCNQTECEIDCERKGYLANLAKCDPNEETGSCTCGGRSCLPDNCYYDKCRAGGYQRGECRNSTRYGSDCYCFGCKQPDCDNECRRLGRPKGICKFRGHYDDHDNEILICGCYRVKRDKPTTAATTLSTLDVPANVLVPSMSTPMS